MSFDGSKQLKLQVMQISNYIIWRHPTTAFLGAIKRFKAKIIKDRFSSCPFNLLLRDASTDPFNWWFNVRGLMDIAWIFCLLIPYVISGFNRGGLN